MSRVALILTSRAVRERASHWVQIAPSGTRFELKEAKRSNEQNALMWVYLTEVARTLDWHGQRYSADDWKDFFMHALNRARWMPSEDGGMVPVGMRTSDLSKSEMGDLITLIQAFSARHGVVLGNEEQAA